MPRDESCDGHDMAIAPVVDSLIIHDLEQEFWSDASAGVVIDSTPLAMISPSLDGSQSQWAISLVHGKFGLGSISYSLSCNIFSPSAVHGSYGYEIVVGDLQSCVDCRSCTVCGFSILGTVTFESIHHCCRVGLCIPYRPVGCVDGIYYVGNLICPLYLSFDVLRVCVSWVSDCGSCDFGVWLSSNFQFDYGFLLVILQRILQEPVLIDNIIIHDYIWDPGGLIGLLFSHCLRTSNIWKGRTCHVPFSNN